MKIKTFNKMWSIKPKECQHEWRLFGTRLCEEVWTPIRNDGKPQGYYGGFVICDKCGWDPHVRKYKIIGKRSHIEPLIGEWPDTMIEILEWGDEKEPEKPIVAEFAYVTWSCWDRIKNWIRNI